MKSAKIFALLLTAVCCLAGCCCANNSNAAGKNDEMLLVVLAGQSNMAGRGKIEAADKIPIPNVYTLDRDGNWVPSVEPTHFDRKTAGTCLGRTFAEELHKKYPDKKIGLVPCAIGGSNIESWFPGGVYKLRSGHVDRPYDQALPRIKRAQQDGKVIAVLWHQGCANALKKGQTPEEAYNYYKTKLIQVIRQFRTDVPELQDVPFIMGELRSFQPALNVDHINRVIHDITKEIDNTGVASNEGATPLKDRIHYDRKTLRVFGQRYFKVYDDMVK